ncbi:MAG TPA: hypothetical protein VGB88_11470 [Alphaproteobacteria bacterium]
MKASQRCDHCQFWVSLWSLKRKAAEPGQDGAERRSKRGQCHRRAPQSSALTVFWPWTLAEDRCGEFEPWPDERRKPAHGGKVMAPGPAGAEHRQVPPHGARHEHLGTGVR